MTEIKIILEGEHEKEVQDKDSKLALIYKRSCSNVYFIKGEKNIIFDTGNRYVKEKLVKALEENNINPDEVDYVIQSHWHLDHCSNIHLFKNAKIVSGKRFIWFPDGGAEKYRKTEDMDIAGVKIINTEGHVQSHISALVEIDGENHIISGDAIRKDYMEEGFFKNEEAKETAIKILKIADVIYPGHGKVIQKEKIKKLLEMAQSK
ncbi:MBL fold metallo-hydrolase [Candidatus Woesearchaeota archaeon]|jgi:glyoxylase-like metal-dependent hydrolase (beta-lactamase superfamily II)|nr:MBL fold metallo-hydrolase [Candidatus Woesearchaeota archaeon]MBT5272680.1 MBL fold metallo-hydrolase [Candidatus Woesearchaeota archaeon]MBT6041287.1 MBL fold metallo-hydrolase [Candidatus Woesearchaeota archaeon]MBT6337075.1 MBL fold metallo-hydrolase [Candidatus Woesearchaeota archaeon]MBT7927871.1 MBL fold metallo-hydrolase [Candidatus Woesearchaeota archaeon]